MEIVHWICQNHEAGMLGGVNLGLRGARHQCQCQCRRAGHYWTEESSEGRGECHKTTVYKGRSIRNKTSAFLDSKYSLAPDCMLFSKPANISARIGVQRIMLATVWSRRHLLKGHMYPPHCSDFPLAQMADNCTAGVVSEKKEALGSPLSYKSSI